MDNVDTIIYYALTGFFILAFLVLWPVYRFIKKQEQIGEQFTQAYLEGKLTIKVNDEESQPSDS